MAGADLKVTIDADAAKLERAVARAGASMMRLESQIRSADASAAQLDNMLNVQRAQALNMLGKGMVAFGAATLAGLGLATKAAIDWETAWTGVLKTVAGSPEELAEVEKGLRGLTEILPASHREIAAVAEAAGQLGIATPDVVAFTKVMVDLGETTNLTAEEAATAIAQLMNVMQTAPEDVGRLGAALVELGNNGASTEADIIAMAQRIAGAGKIIGLSEAEVLALANALASVGIEAEAGGTAISTAMTTMASAVASGGEEVTAFADVAGVSSAEFVEAFEQRPAEAIAMFVAGLGRIDAAGGNVFATLDELGLGGIRVRDSLLRLAGAGDLLTQSLSDGRRAWAENTALIEEAEKRYDTAEAKIQLAKNSLVELAIDVGGVVLPAVAALAEGASDIARFFTDLPGPVKAVATVLGLLVGVAAAAGGGFLLLAPRIAAARAQMLILARTAPVLAGGLMMVGSALRGLTIAGSVVAVLYAVAQALGPIAEAADDVVPSVSGATKALLDLADGTHPEAVQEMFDALSSGSPEGLLTFAAMLRQFDQALAGMVESGNADAAAASAAALRQAFEWRGMDIPVDAFAGYQEALLNVDNQQRLAADSASSQAAAMEALDAQVEAATTALSEYAEQQQRATDPVFNMISALDEVNGAQAAYNQAVTDFGAASPEAETAAVNLAKAVAGAEQAALNGDLAYDEFSAKLAQWVAQGVLTQGQADAIAGRVANATAAAENYEGDYAADLRANVDAASIARANAAINNAARTRTGIIRMKVQVIGGTVTGGKIPEFQHGTDFAPGGLAWVGEEGRELVELPAGSRVHTNAESEAILRNPALSVASSGARLPQPAGESVNYADLARLISREVGYAINGATLIMDDRGRGTMVARQAGLYGRAG